jgi:hypothetical protein
MIKNRNVALDAAIDPTKIRGFNVQGDTYYVVTATNPILQYLIPRVGPDYIKATIAAAVSAATSYDTIYLCGTENQEDSASLTSDFSESVTIPVTKIGIKIIGLGNNSEGLAWANGGEDEDCLTVNSRDCYVSNFRFRPYGAAAYGVNLPTVADLSTNPLGFTIDNVTFRSHTTTALAGIGIDSTNDVTVRDCKFTSVTTALSMYASNNSCMYRLLFEDNIVDDKCTNGVIIEGRSCIIRNNMFCGTTMTMIVKTDGGGATGKENLVTGNTFNVASAYETNCSGESTDDWLGNYCSDVGSSVVGADNGITFGYPQA